MKEVQEMKRVHERFSKKRKEEREARAKKREDEYKNYFSNSATFIENNS
ncbi:hypothetical protein DOY81_004114 [Sarcophaga bullata]|nr:hypothetical protein DOY81_004114 [Sarcophaga bullata]